MTTPSRELDQLQRLQAWYLAHCNGDWEHTYGITISTLDNPGWTLEVELADTELFDKPFETVQELGSTPDWLHCSYRSKVVSQKRLAIVGTVNRFLRSLRRRPGRRHIVVIHRRTAPAKFKEMMTRTFYRAVILMKADPVSEASAKADLSRRSLNVG